MKTKNEQLKILTTSTWEKWQKEAILKVMPNVTFLEPRTDGKLEELIQTANILYGSTNISPRELACSKSLKMLHVTSTGVDRYLVPEFEQSDIILVNSRGVHGVTVGDHAMAMLLALSRGFPGAWDNKRNKKWNANKNEIINLPGKTVGLLGLGAIGVEVAARSKAFGMKVSGIRRSGKHSAYVDEVLPPSGMNQILNKSDFIVCSLPLTQATYHLITIREFTMMKQSAFFINVGRGPVVKESDLIEALSKGLIKGAGLDVFEEEPLPINSPLWEMPNVIITPHSAGFDERRDEKSMNIFVENLIRYQQGRPLVNVVDKRAGY